MNGLRSINCAVALACLMAAACKGDVSECTTDDGCTDDPAVVDPGGTGMEVTTPPPNGNVTVPDTTACKEGAAVNPGVTSMLRLTPAQYNSTVRDLLGDGTNPASKFAEDMGPDGPAYWAAAKALGKAASTSPKVVTCDPAAPTCADQFIPTFGAKAFRRPLTTAEVARYKKVFTTVGGGVGGIDAVIESMLMSADFHYRPEIRSRRRRGSEAHFLRGCYAPFLPGSWLDAG